MSPPAVAGVRLGSGAPLRWCACEIAVRVGELVAVEDGSGTGIGRVVVTPEQILESVPLSPDARVLRPATEEEKAAWEAARFRPAAGAKLLREIELAPGD